MYAHIKIRSQEMEEKWEWKDEERWRLLWTKECLENRCTCFGVEQVNFVFREKATLKDRCVIAGVN